MDGNASCNKPSEVEAIRKIGIDLSSDERLADSIHLVKTISNIKQKMKVFRKRWFPIKRLSEPNEGEAEYYKDIDLSTKESLARLQQLVKKQIPGINNKLKGFCRMAPIVCSSEPTEVQTICSSDMIFSIGEKLARLKKLANKLPETNKNSEGFCINMVPIKNSPHQNLLRE